MEVIYALIPGMIVFGLIMVGVLIWAVRNGQYEDMEGDGQRLLMDDDTQSGKKRTGRKATPTWPDADDDD